MDIAVMAALNMGGYGLASPIEETSEPEMDLVGQAMIQDGQETPLELVRAEAQSDVCRDLYEHLLDRLTGRASA